MFLLLLRSFIGILNINLNYVSILVFTKIKVHICLNKNKIRNLALTMELIIKRMSHEVKEKEEEKQLDKELKY
jgi:hypothetical protein